MGNRRKRREPAPRPQESQESMTSERRGLWAAGLAAVALAAVGAWLALPRVISSGSAYVMGALPRGVRPADLNLLLITLDTTRADRIGAYGFSAVETRTSIGSPGRASCSSMPFQRRP